MSKLALAVALALVSTFAAAKGNPEKGKEKAQACAACHAVGGDWNKPLMPEYPKLAGQHYDYLVTALNAYKFGDKTVIGRKNAVMTGQAAALSKEDIENLAAYLAGLKGPLHVKR